MAFSDDEGRGKLRKVMGSRKQAMNHESPNGATRYASTIVKKRNPVN